MTKLEMVWKLNEELGEDEARVQQEMAQTAKEEHYEQWFRTDILGHKSNYKPEMSNSDSPITSIVGEEETCK